MDVWRSLEGSSLSQEKSHYLFFQVLKGIRNLNERLGVRMLSSLRCGLHTRLDYICHHTMQQLAPGGFLSNISQVDLFTYISCLEENPPKSILVRHLELIFPFNQFILTFMGLSVLWLGTKRNTSFHLQMITPVIDRLLDLHKSEAITCSWSFFCVENQLVPRAKTHHTYRGREYLFVELNNLSNEKGIVDKLAVVLYIPQQNGVAYRRNRTLLKMVHSMMTQTQLLIKLPLGPTL